MEPRSCLRVAEEGAMREMGRSEEGHTHTHTPDTGGGERKGIVSQTRSPALLVHGSPTSQESPPAALGHVRCGPQHCAARRQPRLAWDGALLPHLQCHYLTVCPIGLGELPKPLTSSFPSAARPPDLHRPKSQSPGPRFWSHPAGQ